MANSTWFAGRALSVLSAPEFTGAFSNRDYWVQAALLRCPYGIGLQPLDRFLAVADRFLPDRPWPALEMIEVLQRAARWDDAAEAVRHIHAAIPRDREHQARLDAAEVITKIAAGEAGLQLQRLRSRGRLRSQARALNAILSRFTARMRPLCDLVGGLDARRGRRYPAAVAPGWDEPGIQGVRRCGGRATRVMSNRPCIWRPPGFLAALE